MTRRRLRIAAVAVPLVVVACGLPEPPGRVPAAPPAFSPIRPATTAHVGVCDDPSASTGDAEFAARMRDLLAEVVGRWVAPAPPGVPTLGTDPQAGLDLQLRAVGSESHRTTAPFVRVHIDPVPGLVARPHVSEPGYLDDEPVWARAGAEVLAAASRAEGQATRGAAEVAAFLLVPQRSEIWGCVGSLAQTVERPRSFVIASDLDQNMPAQFDGDLVGTRILVVQACAADAARCVELREQWRRDLAARGADAAAITVVRVEQAATALREFLGRAP